jgi:hypothetical protein
MEIFLWPKTKANPKCASMPRTQSATILALSWQCQRCSHTNDSAKNKKHCFSCQAWRDEIAPLSTWAHGNVCNKAGGIGKVGSNGTCGIMRVVLLFCSSKNDSPNNASPHKVGTSPEKCGNKRKSPSWGNGGIAIWPPLSTRLLPAFQTTNSTITPNPPLQCRDVYEGFFWKAFSFAAKTMHHTANQLQQWAMEPVPGHHPTLCSLGVALLKKKERNDVDLNNWKLSS